MFFKKKEKPVKKEAMMDVCAKAVYTAYKGYVPYEFLTYKDRMEITYLVVDEEANNTKYSATVFFDRGRLCPITLGDEELFFDIVDKTIRFKPCPQGEAKELIPGVLIYPNDVMTIEKEFAQAYYSPEALSYATLGDDCYMWYYPDGTATPVVFETPRLFTPFAEKGLTPESVENTEIVFDRHILSPTRLSLYSNLGLFSSDYLEKKGIAEEDFIKLYLENLKKGK